MPAREGDTIWAFPIAHLGRYASLEEMHSDSLSDDEVQQWLVGMSDFVAAQHAVRLVYTHPFGAVSYLPVLKALLQHSAKLQFQHRFRWYPMGELATFFNRRKDVRWSVIENRGTLLVQASAPDTLNHFTWMFPKKAFRKPKVRSGSAQIGSDEAMWFVDAGDCAELQMEADRL